MKRQASQVNQRNEFGDFNNGKSFGLNLTKFFAYRYSEIGV